jgi:hypothetical protein
MGYILKNCRFRGFYECIFLVELEAASEQVLANPETYQRVGGEVRRKRLRSFPFSAFS